jgi:hypothetical protein
MATTNSSANANTGNTAGPQIITSSQYIQSIANRANTVSDQISQNSLKQQQYNDQQQIYQDQLTQVNKVLAYVQKLDPQIETLRDNIQTLLDFFVVQAPAQLTPAQTDLPPAETTLATVSAMVKQIAARVYQSIQNVNVCAVAIEATYNKLIKNTKHDPDQPPSSGFGHLTVDIGPQNDLVSKLKIGRDTGIAAMEKLANTFLELINYMQALEEIKGFSQYLGGGFMDEITALNGLDARVETRERIALANQEELQDDYNEAHENYVTTTTLLDALKIDYDLLKTEYTAALGSVKPGTTAPPISTPSK